MSLFDKFFNRERLEAQAAQADAMREAEELIAWYQMPYMARFMAELDERATRPMLIGDHMAMLKQAAETNAVRELRFMLMSRIKRAEQLISRVREERESG